MNHLQHWYTMGAPQTGLSFSHQDNGKQMIKVQESLCSHPKGTFHPLQLFLLVVQHLSPTYRGRFRVFPGYQHLHCDNPNASANYNERYFWRMDVWGQDPSKDHNLNRQELARMVCCRCLAFF